MSDKSYKIETTTLENSIIESHFDKQGNLVKIEKFNKDIKSQKLSEVTFSKDGRTIMEQIQYEYSDSNAQKVQQHGITRGKKQIQNRCERKNQDQRLDSVNKGFHGNAGNRYAAAQEQHHDAIGDPTDCQKQRNDISDKQNQLCAGI